MTAVATVNETARVKDDRRSLHGALFTANVYYLEL